VSLDQDIQFIKGIGPHTGKALAKLGIHSVRDFILYFPRAHEDRRKLPMIRDLKLQVPSAFIGIVQAMTEEKRKNNMHIINAVIRDANGMVTAVFYNQKYLAKLLTPGTKVLLRGKLEENNYTHTPQFTCQDVEPLLTQEDMQHNTRCIVPIYALTHGLYASKMRQIAHKLLVPSYLRDFRDPLPETLKSQLSLLSFQDALYQMHFPDSPEMGIKARQRLVFDELFVFQLALAQKRFELQQQPTRFQLQGDGPLTQAYIQTLPYTLTNAQQAAIAEIATNVGETHAMNRLLQGDVGSGKTDVAIMALLMAVQSEKKGAFLAPTQILAEQHYEKCVQRLHPLGIQVHLLTGASRSRERKAILAALVEETPMIIIGTHALLEDPIKIPNLAVAIIDEQHKFGVMQRTALRQKEYNPHCLFMTATPIPRSFLLTSFGDLDKSILDEMPPGRQPISTFYAKPKYQDSVWKQCAKRLQKNEQLFVVYPLIEESKTLDLSSALEGKSQLETQFPGYKVGLIHGRMSGSEKTDIMAKFKAQEYQILVATTVIEVGIDIPNATMIVIMDADRFGLSQLHQLRGRVGRGQVASVCTLIATPKTPNARKRISAMLETTDGFRLSEIDLKIRGPGDILGTRQAGLPEFKLADLIEDAAILKVARKAAFHLIKYDPTLKNPAHIGLQHMLMRSHGWGLTQRLD
jgi:ATP-dependent DNA helicase RecG